MIDYITIHNGEGDTIVTKLTAEQLHERLEENYWGNVEYLTEVPKHGDTHLWGGAVLIIAGNVCVPTAHEVVTKYKLSINK